MFGRNRTRRVATPAQQVTGGLVTRDRDLVSTGMPSPAVVSGAAALLPDYMNVSDDLPTIGSRLADGSFEILFPTGDYVYRAWMVQFQGLVTSSITGASAATLMTRAEDRYYYTKRQYLHTLLSRVKLEADGLTLFDFESIVELEAFLVMSGVQLAATDEGFVIPFGWPYTFRAGAPVGDLYALGTANVEQLKLTLYTNAWHTSLKPYITSYYNPVRMDAKNLLTREVYKRTYSSVGVHVMDDIRIDRRIHRILITSNANKPLKEYEVKIGDVVLRKGRCGLGALEANLLPRKTSDQEETGPYRTSTGQLDIGIGACIDVRFDWTMDGQALSPLTGQSQRRRNDKITVQVETLEADTELKAEVYFADEI